MHEHNIGQSIVQHGYEGIDLVVVELVVQLPVDEALPVSQRHLVDKDYAVLGDRYNVSAAGRGCHPCYLLPVDVQRLLHNVVKDRVEDLEAALLGASQDGGHLPLAGQPAHPHQLEPSHRKHLLHVLLDPYLPHHRLSALDPRRKQGFRSFLVHTAGVTAIALGPLPPGPLLALGFGVTLLPLGDGPINAD